MQAKLIFNLPEDERDFKMASRACEYFSCLWEIDQEMRSMIKHGSNIKKVDSLAQRVRDMIHENVDLYEVG